MQGTKRPRGELQRHRLSQPKWGQGPRARPASCSSLPGTPPPPPNLETPGISSEYHTSGLKPLAPCWTSPSASWRPQSGQPGGLEPQAECCWIYEWCMGWYGEENGNPLQYSCLDNPMDRRAWQAPVHGVAKSQTQLSNFHSLTH